MTFDSTSGSSGKATPRIFVGVSSTGTNNLFVSDDAGSTCTEIYKLDVSACSSLSGSAIAGTNSSWIPHKGVLSPTENVLYISTSDGAGPYDGTLVCLPFDKQIIVFTVSCRALCINTISQQRPSRISLPFLVAISTSDSGKLNCGSSRTHIDT